MSSTARSARCGDDDPFLADAADDYVIDRLSEMGAIAIPELISTLDPMRSASALPNQPRASAVRGLQRVGRPAIPALLETLRTGTLAAKAGSAEVLGQLKVVEAVPLLLAGWETPDPGWSALHNACRDAFKALGNDTIPRLTADLRSASPERRLTALNAMAAIGTTATVPYLLTALEDDVWKVRFEASFHLQFMGAAVVTPLLDFLTRASPAGRAAAAFRLGQIKDARALPALHRLVTDPDEAARSHAALALGCIRDSTAESTLICLLRDEKPEVANSAAWSLGELKGGGAVEPLIRCLAERNEEKVRKQAATSLEKIGTQPALEAAKQYWREILALSYHTTEAGDALGRMKDSSAVPLLIQAMQHGPESARSHYIRALAVIDDSSAVPAIIERLHDRDVSSSDPMGICASAIEALEQMKDTRAIEPLTEMLSVNDTASRKGRICDLAAKALQSIDTAESIARAGAHWRIALADTHVRIRLLAAEMLAGLRYEPATEQLIAALSNQKETGYYGKRTLNDFAAAALELLGSPAALAALREYWRSELGSTQPRDRVFAIRGLGRIAREKSQSLLIPLLNDMHLYDGHYVADYAADVLKTFQSQEARLALAKYFERQQKR